MAVTLNSIKTNLDTYLGDSTNDRITEAERFQFITEATSWLSEELGNEHSNVTYTLDFIDTVNYYKVTSSVADLLIGADLRRPKEFQYKAASRKSSRELAEEIGQRSKEFSWGIERRDGDAYIVVTLNPDKVKNQIATFDTLTGDNGEWVADTTDSDAFNVTSDINEKKQGSASLNFDIDVSQSVNDYATIYNNSIGKDLNVVEDLGSFLFWVYIPDATEFTSVTLTWGSDGAATPATISNYWSATKSTDVDGAAWTDGWNRVEIKWKDATLTGSPDSSNIEYFQFNLNYSGSQGDDTDFRIDDLFIAQPEPLTFHYISWNVGTDNSGTDISAFAATTDVPFFSGQYDQYKYVVAHKAASLIYYSALRLPEQGAIEERDAIKSLDRYRKIFESSKVREEKNFKVGQVNLRNRRARNFRNLRR